MLIALPPSTYLGTVMLLVAGAPLPNMDQSHANDDSPVDL